MLMFLPSGTKKRVPITVHSIVSGVAFVIDSWGLTSSDICLNMMPLNHVGGIVRNLFAPIMAGGSTICCPAFDPNMFCDILEDLSPTWYYASPTMHSAILDAMSDRQDALAASRMRLVCNAAGGLLPSLALRLRDTFNCAVLPSYGMTEAMPIACPPLDFQLTDRPGTSGRSVGPEVVVLDENSNPAPCGTVGQICVRGSPVFDGYFTTNDEIDKSAFNIDGWFGTGDMGYLDRDNFLYITGRSKEVINRGGELISPFEVEEAIMIAAQQHGSPLYGRVSEALAFSAAHDVLQEVVGIAIVTPHGAPRADLRLIQAALKSSLHSVKVPVVLVYMDSVPKNNNKVLRIKLAERLGLATFSEAILPADRHFEAICPPPNTALSVPISCTPCAVDFGVVGRAVADAANHNVSAFAKRGGRDGYPEVFVAPEPGFQASTVQAGDLDYIKDDLNTHLDGFLVPDQIHMLDEPIPTLMGGYVDEARLEQLIRAKEPTAYDIPMTDTQRKVSVAMASVLGTDKAVISPTTDFFELGGDSLRAGKLLAMLRKDFQLRLPVDLLFNHAQVEQLSALIDEKLSSAATSPTTTTEKRSNVEPLPGCRRTCSSTNFVVMVLQLIPMVLVYPLKRALTWTFWMYMITATQTWITNESMPGRLFNLIFSLGVARSITQIIAPVVGILAKWFIVGTHEEGMFQMWGTMHSRWWLTQKIVEICGMGMFRHFNWSRVLYYRLLGATIGKNVTISPHATLGEWDLLEIGDGSNLDACICRPFACERNTSMYLGRIVLGKDCHVGMKSIVAAGTELPDHSSIGPNSSSWEVKDFKEDFRHLSTSKIVGPHWTFTPAIMLIQMVVKFFGALPWMMGLLGLVKDKAVSAADEQRHIDYIVVILRWFASPRRLAFHYLAVVMNVSLGPIFLFAIVLVIKSILDITIGKTIPGPAHRQSQLQKFRKAVMNSIMSNGRLHDFTELFGQHYEITSIAVRLLGGKVGKRVYWPGTGPTIGDYDLIEIGDDVVFGSRAHLVTSDGNGSGAIRIESNAMVADRVVLLPGVILGERCVMGSGAMTTRGTRYAADTTWVGSKAGEAVCLTQGHTSSKITTISSPPMSPSTPYSPKQKPSFLSISARSCSGATLCPDDDIELQASGLTTAINSVYSSTTNLNSSSTPQLTPKSKKSFHGPSHLSSPPMTPNKSHSRITRTSFATDETSSVTSPDANHGSTQSPFGRAFYSHQAPYYVYPLWLIIIYSILTTLFTAFYWNVSTTTSVQAVSALLSTRTFFAIATWYRPLTIFAVFTLAIALITTSQALLALLLVIASKWILLGRRTAGSFDWDKSSYCQRWQLFLTIEKLRRHCYGGSGILGLLTGTAYIAMYFRLLGARIGADCALFASGKPSLMFTEPDLLELGARVAVDDASLVSHINSRGHFTLNELRVGEGSVLRSGSRLLSGAGMERESCLLEHCLIMAGDVVEEGGTRQGWPAEEFEGRRIGVW